PVSSGAVLGRTATSRSFNARLRDELLNGEIFYTLQEAQIVIENWRRHYNTIRPHASLGYKPPAPELFVPGCAPSTGFARHAGATHNLKLTFHLDRSAGLIKLAAGMKKPRRSFRARTAWLRFSVSLELRLIPGRFVLLPRN